MFIAVDFIIIPYLSNIHIGTERLNLLRADVKLSKLNTCVIINPNINNSTSRMHH